jgi:luciferase-like monooxygenase
VRGLGAGRRTRRSLEKGGTGTAGALNEILGAWPRVKITPMFGRWGYFVGPRLFACFPLRVKDTDLWIRLSREDQRRAMDSGAFTPHPRLGGQGWVVRRVQELRDAGATMSWLKKSYETARRIVEREEREEP